VRNSHCVKIVYIGRTLIDMQPRRAALWPPSLHGGVLADPRAAPDPRLPRRVRHQRPCLRRRPARGSPVGSQPRRRRKKFVERQSVDPVARFHPAGWKMNRQDREAVLGHPSFRQESHRLLAHIFFGAVFFGKKK